MIELSFRAKDGQKICHFEPKSGQNITTLVFDNDNKVYVVVQSGRIIVCKADIPENQVRSDSVRLRQIITEFPNNQRATHCITVLTRADGYVTIFVSLF